MAEVTPAGRIPVNVQWALDPMRIPTPVNQVMIQGGFPASEFNPSDGAYLSFGHANPPIVPQGLTEEQAGAALVGQTLFVAPIAQLYLSVDRVRELHRLLGEFIARSDAQRQQQQQQ
jgi:hypothetical protein